LVVAIDIGAQWLQGAIADLTVMRNRRAAIFGGASIVFSAYWTAF
jgi:hypothetical protein